MPEPRAQRTLVKSPPELWAEVSDVESLARHLGEFGEIRITRLDPETTVAWEGDRACGTVALEPAGWGTKVTLTAKLAEQPAPEPPAARPEPVSEPAPVAVEPEPAAADPEPGAWQSVAEADPEPDASEPAAEAEASEAEAPAAAAEAEVEASELDAPEPGAEAEAPEPEEKAPKVGF